jgi:cardiolipin synthase
MRGALCLFILLILLPIGQGILSSTPVYGAEASAPNIRICEVLPRFPSEHIGLMNLGTATTNITGWSVSDGEGTWVIENGPSLAAGGELFIGSNLTFMQSVHPSGSLLDLNQLARKGRVALADEGDEVILANPQGTIVDVLAYGKSSYAGAGWIGEKVTAAPEGKVLRREHVGPYSDSNTKSDWEIVTLGRSGFLPVSSESMVEPFLCPDQMRSRLLREISFAHCSIDIEVYILSDKAIASALMAATDRGVRVRILVEGEPVGGLTDTQMGILQALKQAGCEVYIISDFHGFKRFDYLHPKVLIVDGRRVLVASENFALTSMESNRGWGISIDSPTLADAFLEVFQWDVDSRYPDIRSLGVGSSFSVNLLEDLTPELNRSTPEAMEAKVETVLAPDFGYSSILDLIEGARNRLYLELYYISDQWQPGSDPYGSILSAARRGASVRLILDGNWYNNEGGKGNTAIAERMNEVALAEGLDLIAKTLSPYHGVDTLHNKGAIADDRVLICSINWVRASFERNREVGVVIDSAQVAEFYARAFRADWVDDAIDPELTVETFVQLESGRQLVLNASAIDNSGAVRVLWDVDCDGSIQGEGTFFVTALPPGETLILVIALDPSNNSCSQTVKVEVAQQPMGVELPYAVAASLTISFIIWRIRKRVKRT